MIILQPIPRAIGPRVGKVLELFAVEQLVASR
jgi:hypothetical protein